MSTGKGTAEEGNKDKLGERGPKRRSQKWNTVQYQPLDVEVVTTRSDNPILVIFRGSIFNVTEGLYDSIFGSFCTSASAGIRPHDISPHAHYHTSQTFVTAYKSYINPFVLLPINLI
jgi:hypothetical protein